MNNDVRDAMIKWWLFKYPQSWSVATKTDREILLGFGQDCIDYAEKRLAETAGQGFDEAEYKRDGLDLKTAKLVHERTAAGDEAKLTLALADRASDYVESLIEITKERDEALDEVEALKNKLEMTMLIADANCDACEKERDEAIAKVADMQESVDTLTSTCRLKQMTIIEAQKNRDEAAIGAGKMEASLRAQIKELKASLAEADEYGASLSRDLVIALLNKGKNE